MILLILAGGSGTRLWPLSREDFPKQFLRFGDNLSLLQKTVCRFAACSFVQKILIATNENHRHIVEEQLSEIDTQCEILVEPERKNTGPAIAFALRYLEEKGATKEDQILVLPSDHLIEPQDVFLDYLEKVQIDAKMDKIITFGIHPTSPETGYGYIECAEPNSDQTYVVKRFIEKPNLKNAQQYIDSDKYYWNSGIFLFSLKTFWQQLALNAPDIFSLVEKGWENAKRNYSQFPNISIDYALMEKSKEILVCPMLVDWLDVGSWDSVYAILEKDQNQNAKLGNIKAIDTKDCLIMGDKKLIVTMSVENLLIIQTKDGIFIGKKGESQRIKQLVQVFENY